MAESIDEPPPTATTTAPDVPKWRPHKVVHCVTYREDFSKPTFVVDVTDEFERKLAGQSYLEILAAGGGILSSVRAVRATPEADLVTLLGEFNHANDGTIVVHSEYLEAVITKR